MTNIKTKTELSVNFKVQSEKDVLCCKYTPNNKEILAGCTDGALRLYESRSGKLVNSFVREDMEDEVPVTSIHFKNQKNDSSRVLVTYTDGKVILWDCLSGSIVKEVTEQRQTLGSEYHPKHSKFLTVGDDSDIFLYDEETMQVEQVFTKGEVPTQCDGHNNRVFAAKFHPTQSTEFVSGGWDSVVHFWDIRQPNSLRYIKGVHMCGEGLDLNKSGRELLTCSYSRENSLQMWHYHTGRLLANIEPDTQKSMLYCGQWVNPDIIILGGTDPNLLRVVSLKTLTTVLHYKGTSSGVYALDHCFKPSTRTSNVKKDLSNEIKVVFSIDKSLVEVDVTL